MKKNSGLSRRNVLKSVAAAGFGTVSISVQEVNAAVAENEIDHLTGKERKKTLRAAYRSADFNKIRKEFEKKKSEKGTWRSLREEAVCTEVILDSGESYRFVVLPFKTGNGQQLQANLLWFDRELRDVDFPRVLGHVAYREDEKNTRKLIESETTSVSTSWDITTYRIESDEITTKRGTVDGGGTVSTQDNLPGSGGGSGDSCLVETVTCDSWDWSCMLQIAAGVAGGVASCAACAADPTKLSCGLCLFYLSAGGATAADCAADGSFWKDDCQTDTVWVTESEFEATYLTYPYDCKYEQ